MKTYIAALVFVAAAAAPAVVAQETHTPALESFEFIGCSGDFEDMDATPEIWRVTADGKVSFLTHTVGACGLAGRAPAVAGNAETLDLNYELFSPTDAAIMCECEYWARFTFGPGAHTVKTATFGGNRAVLKGTWPGR
ncbi:hypothetical protein H4F99_11470 [Lysobacter sp. SG-8]|uniref:DUF306 domain-containing protein n=1 Tax=Marilutibacter penaei TaxID=2759900 RepID=A0A7W3YER2_9GAMM|nr:hypothetical protein [Lysobacter penaei]MBB1089099.1 hypothetical protein [Lysobacter penaei]